MLLHIYHVHEMGIDADELAGSYYIVHIPGYHSCTHTYTTTDPPSCIHIKINIMHVRDYSV